MFFSQYRRKKKLAKLYNFAKTDIINPPAEYGHCFVFGSNLMGAHDGGAAKTAEQKYAAQRGVSSGPTGNSYAIPTVGTDWRALHRSHVGYFIDSFLKEAKANPQVTYHLTAIGCGIAGFHVSEIAPYFFNVPKNVILPKQFYKFYLDTFKESKLAKARS